MATTVEPKRRFKLPHPMVLREWAEGYIFAAPFIIGFLVFTAGPMGYAIWMSLQKWDLISPPQFVGLRNIIEMLQDPPVNHEPL